jgi:hypothetical protein
VKKFPLNPADIKASAASARGKDREGEGIHITVSGRKKMIIQWASLTPDDPILG